MSNQEIIISPSRSQNTGEFQEIEFFHESEFKKMTELIESHLRQAYFTDGTHQFKNTKLTYPKIIGVIGERGSGKSSFILTFKKRLQEGKTSIPKEALLPIIEPGMVGTPIVALVRIMGNVIESIRNQCRNVSQEENVPPNRLLDLEFTSAFPKIRDAIEGVCQCLGSLDASSLQDRVPPEMAAEELLTRGIQLSELRSRFHRFLFEASQLKNIPAFIQVFDDLDLEPSVARVLAKLCSHIASEHLVIIIAAERELLGLTFEDAFLGEFPNAVMCERSSVRRDVLLQARIMANHVLEKLVPISASINLVPLRARIIDHASKGRELVRIQISDNKEIDFSELFGKFIQDLIPSHLRSTKHRDYLLGETSALIPSNHRLLSRLIFVLVENLNSPMTRQERASRLIMIFRDRLKNALLSLAFLANLDRPQDLYNLIYSIFPHDHDDFPADPMGKRPRFISDLLAVKWNPQGTSIRDSSEVILVQMLVDCRAKSLIHGMEALLYFWWPLAICEKFTRESMLEHLASSYSDPRRQYETLVRQSYEGKSLQKLCVRMLDWEAPTDPDGAVLNKLKRHPSGPMHPRLKVTKLRGLSSVFSELVDKDSHLLHILDGFAISFDGRIAFSPFQNILGILSAIRDIITSEEVQIPESDSAKQDPYHATLGIWERVIKKIGTHLADEKSFVSEADIGLVGDTENAECVPAFKWIGSHTASIIHRVIDAEIRLQQGSPAKTPLSSPINRIVTRKTNTRLSDHRFSLALLFHPSLLWLGSAESIVKTVKVFEESKTITHKEAEFIYEGACVDNQEAGPHGIYKLHTRLNSVAAWTK